MKQLLVSVFLFTFNSLIPLIAQAGAISGGGGKVVVCRDSNKQILSEEILDIWEARVLYKREPSPTLNNMTVGGIVNDGIQRLKYAIQHATSGAAESDKLAWDMQRTAFMFLDPSSQNVKRLSGVTLELTDDSFESAHPSNCGVEQLIRYEDLPQSPEILINQDLWGHLDNISQAAAILHEAFYSVMRGEDAESNSIRVRRTVGLVLSGYTFAPLQLPSQFVLCDYFDFSGGTGLVDQIYFFEQKNAQGAVQVKMVANTLGGVEMIGYEPSSFVNSGFKSLRDILDDVSYETVISTYGYSPVDYDFSAELFWHATAASTVPAPSATVTSSPETVRMKTSTFSQCQLVDTRQIPKLPDWKK